MKARSTFSLICFIFLYLNQGYTQITCSDPLIILNENLDNYTEGDVSPQSPNWSTWPGASLGGVVTTDQALSEPHSIQINGMLENQDALVLLKDTTAGHYLLRFDMYVPAAKEAYFNIQHETPTEPEGIGLSAVDVFFDFDGTGTIDAYDGEITSFSFPQDTWFEVYYWADIDNDESRLNINEKTVKAWNFSNASMDQTSNKLSSINFFPPSLEIQYFVDNIDFWQIPAPETGQYCYTAIAIEPGIHPIPSLDCFGGSYDIGGNGSGKKGYWFRYTPSLDGVITMGSCLEGVDTRGWIFEGDCQNLNIVGVNDDQCEISEGGSSWASYREAVVMAGNTYYFLWDDAWEDAGFDFELTFTEAPPTPGNFCQSAIEVTTGEYTIDSFDGNAAVAGPDINNTSASTTNYAQSEWYSFTPDVGGTLTITSCDGAASDTHVYVYTGDCANFSTLNLVAENRDSEECAGAQSQITIDLVEAGVTYYIEWIDRWDEASFFWNLVFIPGLSIDETSLKEGFQVFPNPVKDLLHLQFDLPELAQNMHVRLLNMQGALVFDKALGAIQNQNIDLDVSSLASGTYLVQVLHSEVQLSKKIIIE